MLVSKNETVNKRNNGKNGLAEFSQRKIKAG
jgi:hypothetical protein